MPVAHSCLSCAKIFTTLPGMKSHCMSKGHKENPNVCWECLLSFASSGALQAHLNSPRHADDNFDVQSDSDMSDESDDDFHYCTSCERSFISELGLNQHLAHSEKHNWCVDCARDFARQEDLQNHLRSSPRHAGDYRDESSEDEMDSDNDVSDDDPYCASCKRSFVNKLALNQHLAYSEKHNWCFDCSRDFAQPEDLERHRNSLAHKERIFNCPFCTSLFKSPSGIAMHIESGCHLMTRHHVTVAAHAMRIVPNISLRTITGGSVPCVPTNVTTYIATEDSFNGTAYECFLCQRTFRSLQGLNAHLNSPAHDADEFKCPRCSTEFKLISGFAQHLESEACGMAKRDNVDAFFNDMTAQFSRLLRA